MATSRIPQVWNLELNPLNSIDYNESKDDLQILHPWVRFPPVPPAPNPLIWLQFAVFSVICWHIPLAHERISLEQSGDVRSVGWVPKWAPR